MYASYLSNYDTALKTLQEEQQKNKKFKQFLQNALSVCQGHSIHSFLLAPVQRIPRYKLLLESYLKAMAEGDPHRWQVEQVATTIAEIADFNNEQIRRHMKTLEALELERQLSGFSESLVNVGREMLMSATTCYEFKEGKSKKQRLVALFSDMLLLAKFASIGSMYVFRAKISLLKTKMTRKGKTVLKIEMGR